ncbi:hypothetical protein PVBG_03312 [Plasmodium vivax Brazil I]|uniref:Uncharacterized protein n=1 Tax=Plasmodium vivax (strain Brazil I) TaxID=1033975 RepID=A0A0J9T3J5_PLAV1|nr:hypothetical protein PVBG_03312 [Plasmodium vivax Brazil I]
MSYVMLLIMFLNYFLLNIDVFLRSSNLNILIRKLNDKKHGNCCVETENFLKSIDGSKKVSLKILGCSLECSYRYVTAFNGNTLTDLCNYINFWLDEQKSKNANVDSIVTAQEWENFENLWKTLKEGRASDHQCIRLHEENDISEYSKRIELMTYCINRDYFKSLFKSNTGSLDYN